MAAKSEMTERERIKWLIDGIRSSVNKTEIGCYESLEYFLQYPVIYDFDLDKNADLWEEFGQALQNHYLLEEGEEAYRKLNKPYMVDRATGGTIRKTGNE